MRVGVGMNAQIWHTNLVHRTPSLTFDYFEGTKKHLNLKRLNWDHGP